MKQSSSTTQKILNIWAIILIIWSIYRTKIQLPEWFDEFIAKPIVFIGPIYYFIVKKENKKFFNEILLNFNQLFINILIAIGIGSFFTLTALFSNYAKHGKLIFSNTLFNQAPSLLVLTIVIALVSAISEEIVARGFLLKKLYDESKNKLMASFLTSILFIILHIPVLFTNIQLSGPLIMLFLGTDFILSMINSIIFIERKSIIPTILILAFYNLAILLYI